MNYPHSDILICKTLLGIEVINIMTQRKYSSDSRYS